ncbi:MAG: response regulator [Cyanothece sp. SIO1E1]|nr:response regulator [Cyanothece sp. SIO1E1]
MASQKILIVDDSKVIRMQVKDMLPRGSFEVLEAKDGIEGFDLIGQEHPNLVLLDFFMPRMNGWEVVQKMNTHPQLQSIPVVMMSGRKEDVEATVPELFNYFEFISKPFEQKVLVQAIKSAVVKAKHRQKPLSPTSPEPAAVASGDSSDQVQALKAEIQKLNTRSTQQQAEIKELKKQVAQILTFIRQQYKR